MSDSNTTRNTKLQILIIAPTEKSILDDKCPVPKINAFGGVAVGSINAEFALKVIKKIHGNAPI